MKSNKRKWKKKKTELIDNVRANEILSPLYFLIAYFTMNGSISWNASVFEYTLLSSLIYVYASNYFQPDLDIHHSRPGMGYFPLGRWIGAYSIGRFLRAAFYPINRLWYWLWHPFGYMFTHRGITHWPVIGVWLRVGYLWLWAVFFEGIINILGIDTPYINYVKFWIEAFFPWNAAFGSNFWFLFCFPIYLSDGIHILVDYLESVKRGYSFCPPKIPRGFLAKLFKTRKKRKRRKK